MKARTAGIFVGLPLGVGSIMAGYYANSWHDAVNALIDHSERWGRNYQALRR